MRRIWRGERAEVMSHVLGELWVAWSALAYVRALTCNKARLGGWRQSGLAVLAAGGPYGMRVPGRTEYVWMDPTLTLFALPSL